MTNECERIISDTRSLNSVSAGVSLADIERNLYKKSMKVTRRPGNAKPAVASAPKVPCLLTLAVIDRNFVGLFQWGAFASSCCSKVCCRREAHVVTFPFIAACTSLQYSPDSARPCIP